MRLWVLVPGVVLATAAHVGADLVGVRGLRWLMRIEPPRSLVISDNPMRAFLMELLRITSYNVCYTKLLRRSEPHRIVSPS